MLITKQDIEKYREVSRNVADKKINPHIEDAQFLDLRPLLGERMYQNLIKNATESNYTALLEGGEYTYGDHTYHNPGLKKVLSIFAYSRYIVFGSYTDTGFGLVQKSNQDSTPVAESSKRNIHTRDRDTAMQYWYEVVNFLNRKSNDYPLWTSGCKTSRPGKFRISKIS
ncbi:MAG: hypothetical protein CMH22_01040 [Methylophaga sp.]|nr:hypothetical protein [Methylophaga sp.]|tara:strand:+ start:409 stop:915 length:507 start_codon:yes stop_codon:yes gene_type:complete